MRKLLLLSVLILGLSCWGGQIRAAGFVSANLWLSNEHPLAGSTVKISSIIANEDTRVFGGQISFEDNGVTIGMAQSFELAGGDNSQVFSVSWQPAKGQHTVRAILTATYFVGASGQHLTGGGNVTSNSLSVLVDVDSDGDTIPDQQEASHGTNPNNPDSDGDTDRDNTDPAPLNPKVFSVPDGDKDKIPDALDSDWDNDGLYNNEEAVLGTNPRKFDTDGDGVGDKQDAFPLDPSRWERELADENDGDAAPDEGAVLGEKVYNEGGLAMAGVPTQIKTTRNGFLNFNARAIWKIIVGGIILLLILSWLEFRHRDKNKNSYGQM